MLEISRYLVAAQLGSAWGETEREGRMYRHYVLHQSHTLALAERRKDVSATLEDFFCYEQISLFTKSGGGIALWTNSQHGQKELVDGDQGLRAAEVAADLTIKYRLSAKYRFWSGQIACADTQTEEEYFQPRPSASSVRAEGLLRSSTEEFTFM